MIGSVRVVAISLSSGTTVAKGPLASVLWWYGGRKTCIGAREFFAKEALELSQTTSSQAVLRALAAERGDAGKRWPPLVAHCVWGVGDCQAMTGSGAKVGRWLTKSWRGVRADGDVVAGIVVETGGYGGCNAVGSRIIRR